MGLTHGEVFERRRQVTSLMTQGLPPAEIAGVLDVPLDTVYNDIREIRSGRNPELAVRGTDEIFAQVFLNFRTRMRHLWNEVRGSEFTAPRLFALRELRLQDVALLRYANQIAHSVKMASNCEELTQDEAKLLKSLSMRFFLSRFTKPRASAPEIRQLKEIIERLKNVKKFTNRPSEEKPLAAARDRDILPQHNLSEALNTRRETGTETQAGKKTNENL